MNDDKYDLEERPFDDAAEIMGVLVLVVVLGTQVKWKSRTRTKTRNEDEADHEKRPFQTQFSLFRIPSFDIRRGSV